MGYADWLLGTGWLNRLTAGGHGLIKKINVEGNHVEADWQQNKLNQEKYQTQMGGLSTNGTVLTHLVNLAFW